MKNNQFLIRMFTFKLISLFIIISVLFALSSGCKKDPILPPEEPTESKGGGKTNDHGGGSENDSTSSNTIIIIG